MDAPQQVRGLPVEERFWSSVAIGRDGECWPWRNGRRPDGYGIFQVGNRAAVASRVAYELTHGPIPDGLCVCHTCDNPPCVNPAHLWLGTRADNNADKLAKGRLNDRKGRANSRAVLTEAQVFAIRSDPRIQREIAAEYGVSRSLVGAIKRRECWPHI